MDAADLMENTLLSSVAFTKVQLDYAYNNFERSPAAVLSFLAANTGIANTPADLGSLIDGVPVTLSPKNVLPISCAQLTCH